MQERLKPWATIALVCIALVIPHAHAQSGPTEVTNANAMARPTFIVVPDLPVGDALSRYPTTVEVRGTISTNGRMESFKIQARDGDDVFASAVAEVVKLWRFQPALAAEGCELEASEAVLKLIFQLENGKPQLALPKFERTSKHAESKAPDRPPRKLFLVKRPIVEYPRDAQRQGVEGSTMVIVSVDVDGNFHNPTVVYSSPMRSFGVAMVDALSSGRMNAIDANEEPDRNRRVCVQFPGQFCLSSRASVRDQRCTSTANSNWDYGLVLDRETAKRYPFLGD